MTDDKMEGGCLCGAVRYAIEGAPIAAGHCSCTDCRRASGAGHITAVLYAPAQVTVSGETSVYVKTADSGATVSRYFCPGCGSRLFSESTGMAGLRSVMAGTLDDPAAVVPQLAVFARNSVPWDAIDPALPAFPEMPPPREG